MVFRSRFPDVNVPEVSVPEFVLSAATRRGNAPAFVEGPTGRVVTYHELVSGARRVAAGLARRGLKKGDVLALYAPNIPEYALAFHGMALLGGITTTANPLYTADELAFQLKDSGAKHLITVPAFLDKASEAARKAGVKEVFTFGEAPGATPFARLLEDEGPVPEVAIDPRRDLVALPYSSGTTGLPKGVMLTHHNLVANLCQIGPLEPITEADTLVGVLPFFHIYGLVVILNYGLSKGARIVTVPRFELEPFLELLQKHQVTRAHLVPPIVLALAKHPVVDKYNLSALRTIVSGAAPLGAELAGACTARLGCLMKQGYGLTETSPVTHIIPEDGPRAGAVGVLAPGTECKVMDPGSGAELGPGETGELWIRGPQVMRGYLNRPSETAAVIDSEGFFHTGDLGYVDADGYFFIVDRLKELIKYKGMQIAPAELEALLLTHPAVADAAVIPSPDEEAGEVPKAFVVLKGQVTPEDILAFVAGKVAPHKKIRLLEVVEQIPKAASGKILRRILVERERQRVRGAV